MSRVEIDTLPREWEVEFSLAYEADPLIDAALAVIDHLTHEQRLALLDSLGIDYSEFVKDDEPGVEVEPEVELSEFDKIFNC